jgi:hypothetical protein
MTRAIAYHPSLTLSLSYLTPLLFSHTHLAFHLRPLLRRARTPAQPHHLRYGAGSQPHHGILERTTLADARSHLDNPHSGSTRPLPVRGPNATRYNGVPGRHNASGPARDHYRPADYGGASVPTRAQSSELGAGGRPSDGDSERLVGRGQEAGERSGLA